MSVPWKMKSRVSSGYQKSCKNACEASGHEGCVTDHPVVGFRIAEQSCKLAMIHFFFPTAGTLTGFETTIRTFVFLNDFPLCSYFCVFLRYVITSPPAAFFFYVVNDNRRHITIPCRFGRCPTTNPTTNCALY